MATQTHSLQRRDKLASYVWAGEQKLTYLLAITLGTTLGILIGLFRAAKSLAPNFKSVAGVKRLYYGDPTLVAPFHRSFLKDSYASAKLRSPGGSPILTSTPTERVAKTDAPALANGDGFTGTSSQSTSTRDAIGTKIAPSDDKYSTVDSNLYKDSSFEGSTPKSGTTVTSIVRGSGSATPKSGAMTPNETEGETETDDDASEYTNTTTSAPTTPRGSVLAPQDAGDGKKKKKKHRVSKGIKKTFSKLADALTPGHTTTKP